MEVSINGVYLNKQKICKQKISVVVIELQLAKHTLIIGDLIFQIHLQCFFTPNTQHQERRVNGSSN